MEVELRRQFFSGMDVESLSLVIFSLFNEYIPQALNALIALTLENAPASFKRFMGRVSLTHNGVTLTPFQSCPILEKCQHCVNMQAELQNLVENGIKGYKLTNTERKHVAKHT